MLQRVAIKHVKSIVDKEKVELEKDIKDWIRRTSKVRPELGGLSLCPFSSKAKYTIIKTKSDEIKPVYGYDIVFFVIEDHFNVEQVQYWVDFYNNKYPELIFFEDCPQNDTLLQGISTSNGKYNIITMQNREYLQNSRKKLVKSKYYSYWEDELLKEILDSDYEMIKKRSSR